MSLIGALDAGATALAIQQATISVTGNNIANVANPDYNRQTVNTSEAGDIQLRPGISIGTGVNLDSVQRQVDDALTARLRSAVSDNSSASTTKSWLNQVQASLNALSGQDLSSQMNTFFNSWSGLANNPTDTGLRQVVIQNGQTLAQTFNSVQGQLGGLQNSIDQQLQGQVTSANGLADQVAKLNQQIVVAESGSPNQANALRDKRDAVLKQLSQLMNISTIQQPNGEMNVYVGSESLVDGTNNHGVALRTQTDATGNLVPTVIFKSNNGTIPVTGGEIGGLVSVRAQTLGFEDQVDTLAHGLIFELNKIHSSGQGTDGYTSVTASNIVKDPTKALTDPAAGLPFTPNNGSFVVHVKDPTTGTTTSTLVQVSLTGAAGDTTLNSLTASLNAIAGVTASVTGGKLTIATAGTDQISFSQDSSGTLAALGINTFFSGKNASDIAVNSTVSSDPTLIAAAQNGNSGDNQTALQISKLGSTALKSLNGLSLNDSYQGLVNEVGTSTAAAQTNADAAQAVQDTLTAQQSGISGVSLNEEMVNLIQQQQGFQSAARLVTAVQAMMQTLIQMV